MNTRKNIGYGTQNLFYAIAIIALAFAALSMTGCEQPTDPGGDTTAPVLSNGNATRTSDTAATIGFTTNEAGTAYYAVVEKDATIPAIPTASGASLGAVTVGANSGKAVTLTAGAKDIYVVVQDAAGNISAPLKIPAAAYTPAVITYTIAQTGGADNTADTTGIVFTFNGSLDSLNLTAADITMGGAAAKESATFAKSGSNWLLSPITVNAAGNATVSIAKTGIEAGTKNVTVYKAGETAPTLTGITATYTQTATVYPTTPLDDLKAELTVTAQYTSGGDSTLSASEYTLSVSGGALTVPTSTVTVSYQDQTDDFTVTVTAAPVITITAQPAATTNVTQGSISGSLTVAASVNPAVASLSYQWYSNTANNAVGGTVVNGATGASFAIPTVTTGTYYYFCELSAVGAESVRSNAATVTVTADGDNGTPGLEYELITSGTIANTYRVRKGTVTSGTVVIPATYNGLPVTDIDSEAFDGCTGLTGVTIPDSVTFIDSYAFRGCTGLTGVTIGSGVTSIGSYAPCVSMLPYVSNC